MIKHFSAGGVLVNSENKIFLLRKISRNEWGLPKGTIEKNENKAIAAIREVKEETGYENVEIGGDEPFENTFYKMKHSKTGEEIEKTVYYFIFKLLNDSFNLTPQMKAEGLEGSWFTIDEAIDKVTFSVVKEVLKKAKLFLKLAH